MSTPDLEAEQTGAVAEADRTHIATIEASLRRHRIWLAVLTAILGLFVITALASIGLMSYGFGSAYEDMGVSDEAAAEAKSAIREAYG
ncbi:MAG TPA: hypothetical protein VLA05_09540, partial [Coriobacteriia bacterium]|nr:hypothetical protein [Coriobacteriia bacterium]